MAGPDGADGAAAAGGVSRLAAIAMNRMKMTAPIAAPNVRFTTLSSVTRDNELSFVPHEGKGGADRRDSWNRLPVNNLCERGRLRPGAAPPRTAIEITESSSERLLYSEVQLCGVAVGWILFGAEADS